MTLDERLDTYTTAALASMLSAWGEGKGVTTKDARIRLLSRLLADPDTFRRAQWTPTEAVLLALLLRTRERRIGPLLQEVRARGEEGVDTAFERLVSSGAVLARWTPWGSKLDVRDVVRQHDGLVGPAPGLAELDVPLPAPSPLRYAAVPDAQVRAVKPAAAAETAAQLVALAGTCARRKIRVNKDGSLSANAFLALRKELGFDEFVLPWLVMLARAAALVVDKDGELRPVELQHLTLGGLLARVRAGFVERGTWLDSLALDDVAGTTFRWGLPGRESAQQARPLVYNTLARVQNDGWFRLDELVKTLLRLDPQLGFGGSRGSTSGYGYSPSVTSPSDKLRQLSFARGAIVQAAWRLGAVDVGTTGDWWRPTRLDNDYEYDRRFKRGEGYARKEDRDLPAWAPPPCDLVIRIPALGRRVLGLTDEEPAIEAVAGFYVGTDFEVVAPVTGTSPALLFQLDRVARAHPAGPGDPVRRWKLEREGWLAALQAGLDGASLLATLATAQGRPLPPNVTDTIAGWSDNYGLATLFTGHDLVEFASRAARDAAVTPGAVAVGERFLLTPAGRVAGAVLDYRKPIPRSLDVAPDGAVTVRPGADLLVEAELAALTEPSGGGRRLSRASLRGRDPEVVTRWLEARATTKLDAGTKLAIRGWCGDVSPAHYQTVEMLQFEDADVAAAALARPEIARHVLGALWGGVVVLKPGARRAVLEALGAIGISALEGLVFVEP